MQENPNFDPVNNPKDQEALYRAFRAQAGVKGLSDDKKISISTLASSLISNYQAQQQILTRSKAGQLTPTEQTTLEGRSTALVRLEEMITRMRSSAPTQQSSQGAAAIASASFSAAPAAAPATQAAPATVQGPSGPAAAPADVQGATQTGPKSAEAYSYNVDEETLKLVDEQQAVFGNKAFQDLFLKELTSGSRDKARTILENDQKPLRERYQQILAGVSRKSTPEQKTRVLGAMANAINGVMFQDKQPVIGPRGLMRSALPTYDQSEAMRTGVDLWAGHRTSVL